AGVGIDRLLNAVAVNTRRGKDKPAVIVDAGSAITVDYVDRHGAFQGGVIFPGMGLMARSLDNFTALLPLVEVPESIPAVPGKNTVDAIQAGLRGAAAGGIQAVIDRLAEQGATDPEVFLAGGDGPLLRQALHGEVQLWPMMTLEGILLAAAANGADS